MYRTRVLKTAALLTALIQFLLGIGYLAAPRGFHAALGLQGLPAWASWPLGLLGARCLAFGFGMLLVWRDPYAHRGWIQAMILVQGLDWAVVLIHLGTGTLQFSQVATAPFLPPEVADVVSASSLLAVLPDRAAGLHHLWRAVRPGGHLLVLEATTRLTRAEARLLRKPL